MERRRTWQIILLCSWPLHVFNVFAPAAIAQTSRSTNSEAAALFNNARALMERGKYAEACPVFEKVQALQAGIGVTFNLADCHEHIGRTASAWAGFQDAAAAADIEGQKDRAQVARERAAALVPKLSLLRLVVSADAAAVSNLQVQREGVPVARLLWSKSVPVDPGTYVISAAAPGREPWSASVVVDKPGDVVAIDVPVLKPAQAGASVTQTPRAGGPASGGHDPPPLRTAVVLGSAIVSTVALEMAIGFTVAANGQGSNVLAVRSALGDTSACYGKPAPDVASSCNALRDMGGAWDTFENAAIVSYVVSGLAAGGAIATLVWWPKRSGKQGALVLPWITPHGVGTSVGGKF